MGVSLLNKFSLHYLLLFVLFAIVSCKPNIEYEISGYTQKIIVDGWISNNEYPKVYLSLNVPLWQEVDSANVLDYVIRYAKVTVSDGEKTEVLTSRWDKTHFPPYVYRGSEVKGEEGKTYTLKVEYSGFTVTSSTSIPFTKGVKEFSTKPVIDNDTLRILSMKLDVDMVQKTAYKVFTQKKIDGYFIETPIVYNSDFSYSANQTFDISPQPNLYDASYDEGSYFAVGDTVIIKFCAIDSVSTQFFKNLSFFSTTKGIGSNIYIGEKKSLHSNVSEPGFGIWWGNSVRYYNYIVK